MTFLPHGQLCPSKLLSDSKWKEAIPSSSILITSSPAGPRSTDRMGRVSQGVTVPESLPLVVGRAIVVDQMFTHLLCEILWI